MGVYQEPNSINTRAHVQIWALTAKWFRWMFKNYVEDLFCKKSYVCLLLWHTICYVFCKKQAWFTNVLHWDSFLMAVIHFWQSKRIIIKKTLLRYLKYRAHASLKIILACCLAEKMATVIVGLYSSSMINKAKKD